MNAMLNKFPLAIGVATLLMATTGNLGAAAFPVGFVVCAFGGACALIRNGVKHTGTANPRSIGISAASASPTKSIDRSADFQSLEMTPHNSVTPRATEQHKKLTPATFTYSLNATAVTASAPDRADLHAASAPAGPAPGGAGGARAA